MYLEENKWVDNKLMKRNKVIVIDSNRIRNFVR